MQTAPTLPNLPPSVAREVLATLCAALPPPLAETAEARAARDETAMAAVAALDPRDAFEAMLAAQIIAAKPMPWIAFASPFNPSMPRGRPKLPRPGLRHDASHAKRAACAAARPGDAGEAELAMHPAAMERAGYGFRDVEVPAAAAASDGAQPPELTEAEQYAAIYADRAARIRAEGGPPKRLDFGARARDRRGPRQRRQPQITDAGTAPGLCRNISDAVPANQTVRRKRS